MTTDLLDFPAIEAPPPVVAKPVPAPIVAPAATAVVVMAPSIKDTVLAQFKEAEVDILALAEKYRDVAYDVATTKGMREATAARLELREKGRFAVQRAEKAVKADVNDLKRVMADEVERLVAIVQPVEDAIDAQIKAEEVRKAAAKAERDRIEAERVARHQAGIDKVRGYLARCQGADMTAERIGKGIELLAAVTFGPEWQEFAAPATTAQCETLDAMRTLHAHAVEREAEAARLEAQRIEREAEQARQAAENVRVAAELAARQRALDAQAAEFSANMARINGHQQRIAEIHAAATGHAGKTTRELFEAIVAVENLIVTDEQYQELAPLAKAAQASTLATLWAMHAAAIAGTHQAMPAPMLQDESHDLSLALSTAPHARLHATEAAAAISAVAGPSADVDLLGDHVHDPIEAPALDHPEATAALHVLEFEVDNLTAQQDRTRDALTQALSMLDELICAHAPKRAAVALFARVSALRDLGGLPRSAA